MDLYEIKHGGHKGSGNKQVAPTGLKTFLSFVAAGKTM